MACAGSIPLHAELVPKYFEHTYGIDAAFDLRMLVEAGLVEVESAADSLDLVTARHCARPSKMRA